MAKAKFKAKPKDLLSMTKFGELGMTMKSIAPLMGYSYEHFSQVIMKNDDMKEAYLTGKSKCLSLLIDARNMVALDTDHKQWEKANESMIVRLERELGDAVDDVVVSDDEILASITLELKGK